MSTPNCHVVDVEGVNIQHERCWPRQKFHQGCKRASYMQSINKQVI